MSREELLKEKNEACRERHTLAVDRLRSMVAEETVPEKYLIYFQDVTIFLLELENVRRKIADGSWERYSLKQKQSLNEILYSALLEDHYKKNYANPAYAAEKLGLEMGQLLSLLCAETRSGIPYAFENRMDYLTILYELFIEVYNCFENTEEPEPKEIRDILYWYASDYCDVFLADRIEEQINPECSFAADIIEHADLESDDYLYRFGEYITENELGTARYLRTLPEETLKKMADVYTEGYRIGFINGKLLDSLIIGILCYIGTNLIGTPYATLISVVVGVTNVIPFFGPYLGAIPSAILILLVDPIQCIYFVIFVFALQQFDGNILGPKILGESTGLSSFMVILAILMGGGLFGIFGMFVGVPVCAVLYAMTWKIIRRSLKKRKLPTDAVDYYNIDCLDPKTLQPQKMENLNLRKKHHSHKKRAEEKEENHENGDTESKSRERDSK